MDIKQKLQDLWECQTVRERIYLDRIDPIDKNYVREVGALLALIFAHTHSLNACDVFPIAQETVRPFIERMLEHNFENILRTPIHVAQLYLKQGRIYFGPQRYEESSHQELNEAIGAYLPWSIAHIKGINNGQLIEPTHAKGSENYFKMWLEAYGQNPNNPALIPEVRGYDARQFQQLRRYVPQQFAGAIEQTVDFLIVNSQAGKKVAIEADPFVTHGDTLTLTLDKLRASWLVHHEVYYISIPMGEMDGFYGPRQIFAGQLKEGDVAEYNKKIENITQQTLQLIRSFANVPKLEKWQQELYK